MTSTETTPTDILENKVQNPEATLTIAKPVAFRRVLQFHKRLNTGDTTINFESGRVELRTDETNKVSIGHTRLFDRMFDHLETSIDMRKKREHHLAVGTKQLYELVKQACKGDRIHLAVELEKTDGGKLEAAVEKEEQTLTRTLYLSTDPNLSDPSLPGSEIECTTAIKPFYTALKNMEQDKTTLTIAKDRNGISQYHLHMKNHETDNPSSENEDMVCESSIEPKSVEGLGETIPEEEETMFAQEHLEHVKVFRASAHTLTTGLKQDCPADFTVMGEGFQTRFILAPRIID